MSKVASLCCTVRQSETMFVYRRAMNLRTANLNLGRKS